MLFPLSIIVLVSMLKDGYEDYKRHAQDNEENVKEVKVLTSEGLVTKEWGELLVGEIIKIKNDEFTPADILVLSTSDLKKGICFTETKNLDGETNLK